MRLWIEGWRRRRSATAIKLALNATSALRSSVAGDRDKRQEEKSKKGTACPAP